MTFQSGGIEYDYHDSYRLRPTANRVAKRLTKQGYKVKVFEFQSHEVTGEDVFDIFPKRFDVWKRR